MRKPGSSGMALALLVGLAACQAPPLAPPGTGTAVAAQVVLDPALFQYGKIYVFQVNLLKGVTTSSSVLTCSDIPSPYRIGSKELAPLQPAINVKLPAGHTPSQAIKVPKFTVPADEEIVIVVQALTLYKGAYVVGSGCEDSLTFKAGTTNTVDIDVRASTGRICDTPLDCETAHTCIKGTGFSQGYCAVQGCAAAGGTCPPGSECVSDTTTGGLCMRQCLSVTDCEACTGSACDYQDCEGRASLTPTACSRVCVWPSWQKSNCCPTSDCNPDGGL